ARRCPAARRLPVLRRCPAARRPTVVQPYPEARRLPADHRCRATLRFPDSRPLRVGLHPPEGRPLAAGLRSTFRGDRRDRARRRLRPDRRRASSRLLASLRQPTRPRPKAWRAPRVTTRCGGTNPASRTARLGPDAGNLHRPVAGVMPAPRRTAEPPGLEQPRNANAALKVTQWQSYPGGRQVVQRLPRTAAAPRA